MGVTVTAIDNSDYAGRSAAFAHIGELCMTGVADMVAQVLEYLASFPHAADPDSTLVPAAAYSRVSKRAIPIPGLAEPVTAKMSRLTIIDHGNLGGLDIGTDSITTASFAKFRSELIKLAPKFEADGFVHLQHCFAATNLTLMTMFADAFDVPVVGGEDLSYPYVRLNLGNYVRVYPLRGGSRQASDTFFWGP
jgi:hypothetical protein